jgi:hypothetical protein
MRILHCVFYMYIHTFRSKLKIMKSKLSSINLIKLVISVKGNEEKRNDHIRIYLYLWCLNVLQ